MNTQFFNTFTALGIANDPPILCCKSEEKVWVITREGSLITYLPMLLNDLQSIPPPRRLTDAASEVSQRGTSIAYLVLLKPLPLTPTTTIVIQAVWSDHETAIATGISIVPFMQPTGYTYASPAPGRWMCCGVPTCADTRPR